MTRRAPNVDKPRVSFRSGRPLAPPLRESAIEQTCTEFLQHDGWRPFKMERQWSEKKRKAVGERGMADHLYIRYYEDNRGQKGADVLWVEWKRIDGRGRTTKATPEQKDWHILERRAGARTLIAGEDFPATIEGFQWWYENSGLQLRKAA